MKRRLSETKSLGVTKRQWWFICVLILSIFAISTPFDPQFSVHGWMTKSEASEAIASGSLSRQIALITLGLFAIVSFFRLSNRRIRLKGVLSYAVLIFLCLAALSIFVSESPIFTAKRVVRLLMLSLGALAVASRLSLYGILRLAFWAGLFSLSSGFISEIVLGTFRPWVGMYRFTGVLDANFQASNCGVLLITSIYLIYQTKRKRIRTVYFLISFLALAFLFLTKSRGGVLGTTVGLVLFGLIIFPRKVVISLFAFIYFICALYFFVGDDLLRNGSKLLTLGRSDIDDIGENVATITGRTNTWKTIVFNNSKQRKILGFGYDSFWTASMVTSLGKYELGSTHNGYLHILLGLGIIGALTYVLIRIMAIIAYIRAYKSTKIFEFAFAFTLLVSFSVIIMFLDIQLIPHLATFIDMILLARAAFIFTSASNGKSLSESTLKLRNITTYTHK